MPSPDSPTDVSVAASSTPRSAPGRHRAIALIVGVIALVLGAAAGLHSLLGEASGRVVTAVAGESSSVVFPDPDQSVDGPKTVTTGDVELRDESGNVEWTGRADMTTDSADAANNDLRVTLDQDWKDPFGTEGLTIETPKVDSAWNRGGNTFGATVTGKPVGPLADQLKPLPITSISGLNGATVATKPVTKPAQSASVNVGQRNAAKVTTAPIDLGPMDFGPLHIGKVTLSTETAPDGSTVTVVRLYDINGALGPVQIIDADGVLRLSLDKLTANLAINGKMKIGEQTGPFSLSMPVSLKDGKVVIGPNATVSVPLGSGLSATGTISIALSPAPGQPLVVADATVTYGTLVVPVKATIGTGANGFTVDAHITKPVTVGAGLTLDKARVTSDGKAVAIAGKARFTTTAASGSASVAGRLTLPTPTSAPTIDLRVIGNATLGQASGDLGFGADLRLTGTIGGDLAIAGTLDIAGTPVAIDGTVSLAGDKVSLDLEATGAGATGTIHLSLDRATGAIAGSAELDTLTVGGITVEDVELVVSSKASKTEVELTVGTLRLPNDRTASVHGKLTMADGAVHLTVDGSTNLIGPEITVSGSVSLANGQALVDLTAATGTNAVYGSSAMALSGQVRITGNVFDKLSITADVDVMDNKISAAGTVALRDGGIDIDLVGTRKPSGNFTIDARYDLGAGRLTGTVEASNFRFRSIELTSATLKVDLANGTTNVDLAATATIGENIEVEVTGHLTMTNGATTLDAQGVARINGIEVAVEGTVNVTDQKTTFDITATADNVSVPLGGQNLALTGAIHLSGELGGEITIDATLSVYGTDIHVTGTATFDGGNLHLVLDATGTGISAHAVVDIVDGNVTATVTADQLTFGDVTITDVTLAITSQNGVLHAEVSGNVIWRDGTFAVTGTVDRDADGNFSAMLSGNGELNVTEGVTVTSVQLAYDGQTITLDGQAHVLTAKVDALVAVNGTVTLGSSPTFDLKTAADGTIALDGDNRMAFTGGLRLRNGTGAEVLIDGNLSMLNQTLAFNGTLGFADGKVQVHLANTADSTVTFVLDLTVDIQKLSAEGHLEIGELTLGNEGQFHIRKVTVDITIADMAAKLVVHGEADLNHTLRVRIDAEVNYGLGSDLTLQFTGQASMLDRFVDVGVAGAIRVHDGQITFDIVAEANASLDFNGSGDLFIDAGFRLTGTLGQPINITGEIVALDNRVAFVGTFAGDLGNAKLHLTEGPGSTTTLLVDVTVVDKNVTAHLNIGTAKIDVIEVSDLDVKGSITQDGTTDLTLTAQAQLADESGKLAGITSAMADLNGTYKRGADKVEDLQLKATISRLETTGQGVAGIVQSLKLDYLNVEIDITRAAKGEPVTVTIKKAELAATRVGDTWVMPNTSDAEGLAYISLTGKITLSDKGKIQAWELNGDIDRLDYQNFILSGSFKASGEGFDNATAELDVAVSTVGGKLDGHVKGNIGYGPGGFLFDLKGKVNIHKVAGLDAEFDISLTGQGTLGFNGKIHFGPLEGDANGRIELIKLANGTTWPRIDINVDVMQFEQGGKWWFKTKAVVFADVTLSNWDSPDTYHFHAAALGAGSGNVILGLASGKAVAGLTADGHLRDVDGNPSFDLKVRALGGAHAQFLGFLHFGAGGAARVDVKGNFNHVEVRASAMAIAGVAAGGIPIPVAGAGVDVAFSADLQGDQVYQVKAVAHAGVSIFGPVLTADADVHLNGTVDLKNRRATLSADARAKAQFLLVIARAKASGHVTLDIDWATPDAKPVITGNARIDIDAHALWVRVAGFHADLRYDGKTLWVTGGDKHLSGNGMWKRYRRVINLRGTLYPNEILCGDQQVKKRFGSWKADGKWGDCGNRGTVTGRVIEDTDKSGTATPGDIGLGNVTVQMRDANGDQIAEVVTEANGTWRMDDMGAGVSYQAAVVVPADRPLVSDPDGNNDGVVPFTINNGGATETGAVVLTALQEPDTTAGALTGLVVEDVAGDGSPDGDAPMADVQVRVEGPVNTTVRTGADGRWVASELPPGDYVVTPVRPLHTVTVDPDGTVDGAVTVTLEPAGLVDIGTFGLHADGPPEVPEVPVAPDSEQPPVELNPVDPGVPAPPVEPTNPEIEGVRPDEIPVLSQEPYSDYPAGAPAPQDQPINRFEQYVPNRELMPA